MTKRLTIKITGFFPADRPQAWKDWRQAQPPNQDAGAADRVGPQGRGGIGASAQNKREPAPGRRAPGQQATAEPMPRPQALVLAHEILNRLHGYARKGSRARSDFYQRDLNWMADVLMRIEASEPDPLRPTGQ